MRLPITAWSHSLPTCNNLPLKWVYPLLSRCKCAPFLSLSDAGCCYIGNWEVICSWYHCVHFQRCSESQLYQLSICSLISSPYSSSTSTSQGRRNVWMGTVYWNWNEHRVAHCQQNALKYLMDMIFYSPYYKLPCMSSIWKQHDLILKYQYHLEMWCLWNFRATDNYRP